MGVEVGVRGEGCSTGYDDGVFWVRRRARADGGAKKDRVGGVYDYLTQMASIDRNSAAKAVVAVVAGVVAVSDDGGGIGWS